jgi:hypothetical protein
MTKYFLQSLLLTTALIAWCGCTPPVAENDEQSNGEQVEATGEGCGCGGCEGAGESCKGEDCEGCELCESCEQGEGCEQSEGCDQSEGCGCGSGTTITLPSIEDLPPIPGLGDWMPLPGTTSGEAIDLHNTTTGNDLFDLPAIPEITVDAPPLPDLGDGEDTDWIVIPPSIIETPSTTTGGGLFDLPPADLDLPGVTSGN